jgi:hypothetical protein
MITRSQARLLSQEKERGGWTNLNCATNADGEEKFTNDYSSPSDDEVDPRPHLRRAGSSTGTDDYYFSDENEGELESSSGSSDDPILKETDNFSSSDDSSIALILLDHPFIPGFISHQIKGIVHDFCDNGLPWDGYQCRSLRAGGSGCLFALPWLFASSPWEQFAWLIQGFLSVWADYFHIHHASIAHGMDRIFANALVVSMVCRAIRHLHLKWWIPCLVALPLAFFAGAHRAKKNEDLEAWHWWHLGWHISASSLCCIVIHLMETCGPDEMDSSSLWGSAMCRPASEP